MRSLQKNKKTSTAFKKLTVNDTVTKKEPIQENVVTIENAPTQKKVEISEEELKKREEIERMVRLVFS